MERELPKPGEKWRHCKLKDGEEYVATVLAIAQMPGEKIEKRVIYSRLPHLIEYEMRVFDTESNQVFWMKQHGSNVKYALFLLEPIYSETWSNSDVTDETIWARPLDSFMGVVSNDCYRFERA